jgi:hypothetical protein
MSETAALYEMPEPLYEIHDRASAHLTKAEVIELPGVGNPSRLAALVGVTRQAIDAWPEVLKDRQENEILGVLLREGLEVPPGWLARMRERSHRAEALARRSVALAARDLERVRVEG